MFGSHPPYVSIGRSCVRLTPVSFPLSGKERRLAICFVPVPPWVVIAIRAFSDVVRLSGFVGSFRVCMFLYGDPDGERRNAENGVGGAAEEHFCVIILALRRFPRGVRWGLRAPKPAPKSHWLSGLSSFDSRQSSFGRKSINLAMLSAGSTLGLKCGSRTAASLDSLLLIRGRVPFSKTWQYLLSLNNAP